MELLRRAAVRRDLRKGHARMPSSISSDRNFILSWCFLLTLLLFSSCCRGRPLRPSSGLRVLPLLLRQRVLWRLASGRGQITSCFTLPCQSTCGCWSAALRLLERTRFIGRRAMALTPAEFCTAIRSAVCVRSSLRSSLR